MNGTQTGTIESAPEAGSQNTTVDHDWFQVSLIAGQTYTFGAAVTSGLTTDYLGSAAIDLRTPSGALISNTLDDSVAPTFTYTATTSGTYFLAISAGGSDTASQTFNYSISVLQNNATPGAGVVDPFVPYTDKTPGKPTANDVVAAAMQYAGKQWAWENCTGLVWAIATEVGGAFYDTIQNVTGSSTMPSIVPDPLNGFVLPSAGVTDGNWTTFSTTDWNDNVQLGDIVRINAGVLASDDLGHSFIIVGGSAGNWQVIDNTDPLHVSRQINSDAPITINPHTFNFDNTLYKEILKVGVTADISRLISSAPVDTQAPVVSVDNLLSIQAGATLAITSSLLVATDNVSSGVALHYTVTSGPAHGTLLLNNAATTSFTQADITNGLVTYHETTSGVTSDAFTFNVTDAAGNATTASFQISITTATHVVPTVNVQNVSVAANASIAASSLVTSVSNPSGDNVDQYVFYDSGSGGGHFTVNGTVQPSGQYIYVDFSNVANALYVGGSSPGSETLYVAVYDATTNSYSNFSSLTATTTQVNIPPTVSLPSGTSVAASTAGQVFQFSSLFSGSDPDGDTLTYYLYDGTPAANSGHFVVNGTIVPADTVYQVSAAQLAQTTFVAGAAGTSDDLYVEDFDGQAYSGWNAHVNVAVAAAQNIPPTVSLPSGASVAASTAGEVFQFSTLFSGSDPDGDTLTYYLYDSNAAANSGHFVVNGAIVPADTIYQVTAAQLAQTTFVAGAAGTSDKIYVEAFDGHTYSGWNTYVDVSVAEQNTPPQVSLPSGTSVTATSSEVLQFSSLFSGSDADGDTLTYYLYDGTPAANSGHFVVNGTIVPADTIYQVSAAQLAQTTFVAGASGTSDDLYVEDFDGQAYSGWNAHVNVSVAAQTAPTVNVPSGANVLATAGQSLQASSLFSGSDPDGDTLTYFLYDGTPAANSGHFVVGGTVVPADTIYQVSAAQLAQATFVAGASGTSDDLYVEDYDGHSYSGWNAHVNVSVNASASVASAQNPAPTIILPSGTNVSATAGQTLQASNLFSGSDAGNDTLTYFIYDNTSAANSGHFVVNGTTVPAQTITQVSAAQLALTTFVAGAAGTSDDLSVEAFDGHAYSGWTAFHVLV